MKNILKGHLEPSRASPSSPSVHPVVLVRLEGGVHEGGGVPSPLPAAGVGGGEGHGELLRVEVVRVVLLVLVLVVEARLLLLLLGVVG